ncbi:hypothetical protein NC652_004355 [Populus alba x Populus x berolinensis]|nr:hypothetical protein NC652_004355 [Populus alba x Populus x berolinensis]
MRVDYVTFWLPFLECFKRISYSLNFFRKFMIRLDDEIETLNSITIDATLQLFLPPLHVQAFCSCSLHKNAKLGV